jgi:hypothetical protein
MKRLFLASSIVLMLSACAMDTKAVNPDAAITAPADRLIAYQSPVAGGGVITVIRDRGLASGFCYVGISIDGKLAAKLDKGEKADFQLAEGRKVISIMRTGAGTCGVEEHKRAERSTEIYVTTGQHHFYRLAASSFGELHLDPAN